MGRPKKKPTPLWAEAGHSKPVTRRELLAAGLIPFAAGLLAPRWTRMLLPEVYAATNTCPVSGAPDMIPFVSLNLAGGAGLQSNFVPHDAGGQLLPSYSLMGLGDNQLPIEREFGGVPFAGDRGDGTLISNFLTGIRQTAPTALPRTAFVALCVRSRDDSGENRFSADGLLAKAGVSGSLLPNLGRKNGSVTGINQEAAYYVPPQPLIVSRFSTIAGSLGYARRLKDNLNSSQKVSLSNLITRLSDAQSRKLASLPSGEQIRELVACAGVKNAELVSMGSDPIDPRKDPTAGAALSQNWGISSGTGDGDTKLVFASCVYNVLKNNAGSAALELGGYDYHNNTRTTGNQKDLEAGQYAGRILESAALLNKPLFLYITSDGSVVSADSTSRDSVWRSDRGTAGVAYVLYFDPSGRPETSGFQIGSFTSGQVADDNFITGGSPERAAAAVVANYLKVQGKLDLLAQVAPRAAFTPEQLDLVLKF